MSEVEFDKLSKADLLGLLLETRKANERLQSQMDSLLVRLDAEMKVSSASASSSSSSSSSSFLPSISIKEEPEFTTPFKLSAKVEGEVGKVSREPFKPFFYPLEFKGDGSDDLQQYKATMLMFESIYPDSPQKDKLACVLQKFAPKVRQWFMQLKPTPETVEALLTKVIQDFGANQKDLARSKLSTRKQAAHEQVQVYHSDILLLCSQVEIVDEDTILHHFSSGLQAHLKEKVLDAKRFARTLRTPFTVAQAKEIAQQYEGDESKQVLQVDYHDALQVDYQNNNNRQQYHQQRQQQSYSPRYRSQSPYRSNSPGKKWEGGKCFYCHKEGHKKFDCEKRKRDQGGERHLNNNNDNNQRSQNNSQRNNRNITHNQGND